RLRVEHADAPVARVEELHAGSGAAAEQIPVRVGVGGEVVAGDADDAVPEPGRGAETAARRPLLRGGRSPAGEVVVADGEAPEIDLGGQRARADEDRAVGVRVDRDPRDGERRGVRW